MAVSHLECPKDIPTVNTYYYALFIHQIPFQYLMGNMVKLTYKVSYIMNLLIKA